MDEDRVITREISDMGVCAYLMMHGFNLLTFRSRDGIYVFELTEETESEFEKKQVEYLKSEFHRFDSYIMSLKKMRMNSSYRHK